MDEAILILVIFALTIGLPLLVAMSPLTGFSMIVFIACSSLTYWWPLVGILVVFIIGVLRLYLSLPSTADEWHADEKRARSHVLVMLGGGAYTNEMLRELGAIEEWRDKFDATFIMSDIDSTSRALANEFENDVHGCDAKVCTIPGPRVPGQSFFGSPVTSLRATLAAFRVLFSLWPDAVLSNGPEMCVPAAVATYIFRVLWWKRIAVLYFESIASVSQLSPAGNVLLQLSDVMTVQWDPLYKQCSERKWYGHVLHGGRCRDDEKLDVLPIEAQEGDGTAIVTVGPGQFDDLLREIDNDGFIAAATSLGIKSLRVHTGSGTYNFGVLVGDAAREAGLETEVIAGCYPEELSGASLVISSVEADAVLECLTNHRRVLLVTMATSKEDHRIQLCEELKKYKLVRWCNCDSASIAATLEGYTGADLRKFPDKPTPTLGSALRHVCGRPNRAEEEERRRARRAEQDRHGYGYDHY